MSEEKNLKYLILAAGFGALGILFPVIFHMIGQGSVFLPMFFPILIMGFFVPFRYSVLVGFIVPYLSAFLTRMPPLFPIGFVMSFECAALAGLSSLLFQNLKFKVYPTVILSILGERLVLLAFILIFNYLLPQFAKPYGWYVMIKSLPGIILQVALVPPIVILVQNRMKRSVVFGGLDKDE